MAPAAATTLVAVLALLAIGARRAAAAAAIAQLVLEDVAAVVEADVVQALLDRLVVVRAPHRLVLAAGLAGAGKVGIAPRALVAGPGPAGLLSTGLLSSVHRGLRGGLAHSLSPAA